MHTSFVTVCGDIQWKRDGLDVPPQLFSYYKLPLIVIPYIGSRCFNLIIVLSYWEIIEFFWAVHSK